MPFAVLRFQNNTTVNQAYWSGQYFYSGLMLTKFILMFFFFFFFVFQLIVTI